MSTSSRRRTGDTPDRAATLYIVVVVVGGAALLALALAGRTAASLIGPRPAAFAVFAALVVITDLRRTHWLGQSESAGPTASLPFGCALLLIAPAGGALLVTACASIVSDTARRRPLSRVAFNAAQTAISLGAGAAVLGLAGTSADLLGGARVSLAYLPTVVLALVAVFATNTLLVSVVVALHQRLRVWPVVRDGLAASAATDGLLLALAPIFVVVTERSLVLAPLLFGATWAIFHTMRRSWTRQHEATHDPLTGVANRREFCARAAKAIAQAKRRGNKVAIVLIDLDGFKGVNDQLGHQTGDLALCEIARRLEACCRQEDLLARLGGDEFVLLLTGVTSADEASAAVTSIQRRLEQPCVVGGLPLDVRGSSGLALYPEHGGDVDTLLDSADVAMYAAKALKLGTTPARMPATRLVGPRLGLLSDLQRAVEVDELLLHYQPQTGLRDGRDHAVEALVRWQHPRLGLLYPREFVHLAEQTGLITALAERVLEQALAQCVAWQRAGLTVRVAVNASTRNLHDTAFPGLVARMLDQTGADPAMLEIETTENTVLVDSERTGSVMAALHALGVRLAIDDFGTGYSSFARLRDLPVDSLKIDRSFVGSMVSEARDALIVRSIADLGRGLGLETVAEGVETAAVLEALRDLGCDAAQGFFIARPADAAATTDWLAARQGHPAQPDPDTDARAPATPR